MFDADLLFIALCWLISSSIELFRLDCEWMFMASCLAYKARELALGGCTSLLLFVTMVFVLSWSSCSSSWMTVIW